MSGEEEIEYTRILRALDIAKQALREAAKPCRIATTGDITIPIQGVYLAIEVWAKKLLKKIEEAEEMEVLNDSLEPFQRYRGA